MSTQPQPQVEPELKSWPGLLQWHSEIHRRWGRCSLHFWLLRFREMYDREEMFDRLVDFMDETGIGAFAAYELSGEFDILLRAWIPVTQAGGFADRLEDTFEPVASREFTVQRVVRHWPWRSDDSEVPRPCDIEALATEVSSEDIRTANRLSDETHGGEAAKASSTDVDLIKRLMQVNAITDLHTTTGIRVFVRLKVKEQLDNEDWLQMTNKVARELDKLTRPKGEQRPNSNSGDFTVDEVSLYRCKDRSLLVLCRVPYEHWHHMRSHLLEPLADMPGVLQTTTLPALSRNFVRSRNHLFLDDQAALALGDRGDDPNPSSSGSSGSGPDIPPPPSIPPGVRPYLERPEDTEFEAKGSAFSPLDPWLCRDMDAAPDDDLHESSEFFRNTIARTVVAMLNSEGGTLVIGVLEKELYARHNSELLKLRIAQLQTAGRFHVLGIQDPTFQRKGWDGFDLKFNRLLRDSIEGEVADLVRLYRDWHGRQTLALVQIEYPGMSDGFWLKDGEESRFLIRRGGSSEELRGTKAQRYIKQKRQSDQRRLRDG